MLTSLVRRFVRSIRGQSTRKPQRRARLMVEGLEDRWCPSSFYWEPLSSDPLHDWGYIQTNTLATNWVDATGARYYSTLPGMNDAVYLDGNFSSTTSITVTANPIIGSLTFQNSYGGPLFIYPNGTVTVTGNAGTSNWQDGHTNIQFGNAAGKVVMDGVLNMGAVNITGSEGTVYFVGTTYFNTASASTTYADWNITQQIGGTTGAGIFYAQETGTTAFTSFTSQTPLVIQSGAKLLLNEASTSNLLFVDHSGPTAGSAIMNQGTVETYQQSGITTHLAGSGAGHMAFFNRGLVSIHDSNRIQIEGWNSASANWSYVQDNANGITRIGSDTNNSQGFLVPFNGIFTNAGALQIQGLGQPDWIITTVSQAYFQNTTITMSGSAIGGYASLNLQTGTTGPWATVTFDGCTFNMHLDGSTNFACNKIVGFAIGNLVLMNTNTVNITQDNPVVKGSGKSWYLFELPNAHGKISGTLTTGTGWANLLNTGAGTKGLDYEIDAA